jgi:hypothetical protein
MMTPTGMHMNDDDKTPIAMSLNDIKAIAALVAEELKQVNGPLPEDLRTRFIDVRAALFQRGVYDPVLVRFDSATVPRASLSDIAAQLAIVASAL